MENLAVQPGILFHYFAEQFMGLNHSFDKKLDFLMVISKKNLPISQEEG